MAILTATYLSKAFGPDEIFSGISVQIPHGAKIALVGPNGAGKTTLINILIGLDTATEGQLNTKRGLIIGYLPQRPELEGERTVWDEMLSAFTALLDQEGKLRELEEALADDTQSEKHDDILDRYGKLQETFEEAGGYTYEVEIKRVLQGLSFDEEDFSRPISQLSGGQITRAYLARLLLEKPELLVLDEPTNHLDIQAVEWLEGYLKSWGGAVLVVSHDRYFMDQVVDTIWELDFGELETYNGNYSHYIQQREERHERLQKEFEAQQAYIQKEQDYIRKHIASQNTAQAKGKRKRLERLMSGTDRFGRAVDKPWLIQSPRRRGKIHVKLDTSQAGRTGDHVLKTKDLIIGYHDDKQPLFTAPDILLLRGEVAAIIGPNGAGKSTFLKTILGTLPPLEGEHIWGSKVQIGYFAQAHENLNLNNSVLDELLTVENLPISKARNYLATYLFTGDDVFRPVSTLSGGERGRLALAKLALGGTNVLLLDEPTNHLDIPAQEILQNVLADYNGTILLISHDRYLVDALASQIWSISQGKMEVFGGSYQEFVAYRNGQVTDQMDSNSQSVEANRQPSPTPKEDNGWRNGLNPYQRQKRIAVLEVEIHELENLMEQLTKQIETASEAENVEQVIKLGQKYTETESALNDKMTEWMSLA